ncbi:MAG: XTP/dITP diphosphohydrolase [Planctomycetota bacterium]
MAQTKQIVIASNNAGKLKEIKSLLSGMNIAIVPQSEFGVSDADECGLSFVENAIIKARHAASLTKLPCIADDSGIEVDLLDGKPGIHSARFAGIGASDEENLRLLLNEIKKFGNQQVSARFQCVMVYLRHAKDPTPLIAQGTWQGHIVAEPRGKNGFGYDPVFYVPSHACTSAELPADIKNNISHRGQALHLLVEKLSVILD